MTSSRGPRAKASQALLFAFFFATSSIPRSARADAYEAAMAQGVVARDRAEDASDPNSWDEALRAFQEADRIRPTKEARYELANAAMHLHAEDVACEAFEGAIALGLSGKAKEKADAFLAIHLATMARFIVLGPAGSHVYVQGRERGALPLAHPMVVFAGKVRARLVTPEGKVREKDIVATIGNTFSLDLTPETIPASATIEPENKARSAISDSPRASTTLDWILLTAGSTVFTGGVITFVVASSSVSRRREDLGRDCAVRDGDECARAAGVALQSASQSDVDAIATGKTLRIVGLASAGVGAAAAIFGAVRLLTMPRETTVTSVHPTAAAIPGGAFFGLGGAF